jgi:ribosome maturation factor RimP
MGYELVGVEQLPARRGSVLRVYIDSEDGVTVDDCARVSDQISAFLDVENPIRGAYTLEISSPGFDRPLFMREHYERCTGSRVKIQLLRPLEGRRRLTGNLIEVNSDELVIDEDGHEHRVPLDYIDTGRLVG